MNLKYLAFFILAIGFTWINWFCANPIPPTGGPRDETPPSVDTTKSTPNYQTNFQKQRIELTFDEWVRIQDVFNQVLISPPLQSRPEITLRGKRVRFDFAEDEVLRPNATYTINFGEAVQDITENNPAENLRFVFSTGPFIDSLEVQGQLVDSYTKEPVKDMLFMLYENLSDTVVRTEKPFYFSKTDEEGRFKIENVKTGTFKAFALEDANFNYTFDDEEKIGFLDTFLVLSATNQPEVAMEVFQQQSPLRILDKETRNYGLVKLVFNQKPDDINITYQFIDQKPIFEFVQDTMKVWYDKDSTQAWNIYVQQDTILNDTTTIEPLSRSKYLEVAKMKLAQGGTTSGSIKLNPKKPILLVWNHPIEQIDTSLIQIFEDSLRTPIQPEFVLDTVEIRNLQIQYPWKEGVPYFLEALPNSIIDIFGIANDSLFQTYNIEPVKSFGTINLTISGLQPDLAYVFELKKGENVMEKRTTSGQEIFSDQLIGLKPDQYELHIITDINQNEKWDAGNYDLKVQSEPVRIRSLEQLRANWDLEVQVDMASEPIDNQEENNN